MGKGGTGSQSRLCREGGAFDIHGLTPRRGQLRRLSGKHVISSGSW